jgi:hypothetical protein
MIIGIEAWLNLFWGPINKKLFAVWFHYHTTTLILPPQNPNILQLPSAGGIKKKQIMIIWHFSQMTSV